MDNRNEIRQFLASRRARMTPEQAGLPTYGGNRRVAGLRREEVALLAGVSVDCCTACQRGNLGGVSEAVLDAITDAPADLRNGRRDILAANRLGHEVLALAADPGLSLVVYGAEPGSASQDGLTLLASWAATLDQAEPAQAPDPA